MKHGRAGRKERKRFLASQYTQMIFSWRGGELNFFHGLGRQGFQKDLDAYMKRYIYTHNKKQKQSKPCFGTRKGGKTQRKEESRRKRHRTKKRGRQEEKLSERVKVGQRSGDIRVLMRGIRILRGFDRRDNVPRGLLGLGRGSEGSIGDVTNVGGCLRDERG